MLSPAVVARLTLCPVWITTLSAGPGMTPPTHVETDCQSPVWAEKMVLWEKLDWKKNENVTEMSMTKSKALLLQVTLIIPQFSDTFSPLINNQFSR
jgi:hypothetical protein